MEFDTDFIKQCMISFIGMYFTLAVFLLVDSIRELQKGNITIQQHNITSVFFFFILLVAFFQWSL